MYHQFYPKTQSPEHLMVYRVGLPLWRLFANLGCTVSVRVNFVWDPEALVFVADSPDLRGLVAEAPDVESLRAEVQSSIDELLQLQLKKPNTRAIPIYCDLGLSDCVIGYYKQVTQHLKNAGFYFLRAGKGSHELWSKGSVTVAVPHNCKSKLTGNAILKQAGIAFKL